MFSEQLTLGFDIEKTKFAIPPHQQTPPDFQSIVLEGKDLKLGGFTLVTEDKFTKSIDYLEVFSSKGKTILNGRNPLSWEYIAKVCYNIDGDPVEISMNPHMPGEVQSIVLELLGKEFF